MGSLRKLRIRKCEEGQATVEYILLIAAIVSFFLIMSRGLNKVGLTQKILKPISNDFAHAYRYGSTTTKGFDEDGGPDNHPRVEPGADGGNNFRIFINPQGTDSSDAAN